MVALGDRIVHKNGFGYSATKAYLRGAFDAASMIKNACPFAPGPQYAQYHYGYNAEMRGEHDNIELPYEDRYK